jgi:hypothetical protein
MCTLKNVYTYELQHIGFMCNNVAASSIVRAKLPFDSSLCLR